MFAAGRWLPVRPAGNTGLRDDERVDLYWAPRLSEGKGGFLAMAACPRSDHGAPRDSDEQVYAVADRVIVDRAKGVLMFSYGIDAATAYELLRSRSRSTEIDVPTLAEQLLSDFVGLTPADREDLQSACDRLLLTVAERISQAKRNPLSDELRRAERARAVAAELCATAAECRKTTNAIRERSAELVMRHVDKQAATMPADGEQTVEGAPDGTCA